MEQNAGLHFLTVGDWGFANQDQHNVANEMGKIAEGAPLDFIISAGDNFYENGVSSVDDPHRSGSPPLRTSSIMIH
jgi:hypothetical protein